MIFLAYGEVRTVHAEKQPEQWRASTPKRNTSLDKCKLSRVNLFTIALLDDFNFVLLRYIL